ncbi:MAG: transcriptional regulator [Candidatus Asgardarchaeia archaeon]
MPICEYVAKYLIPQIRARIAVELYKKYNMTEVKIAEKLGITQAAVSYYIAGKRGLKKDLLLQNEYVESLILQLASTIYRKDLSKKDVDEEICKLCSKLRERALLKI